MPLTRTALLTIVRVLSDKSLVQHEYASVLVRISLLASPPRKRYQPRTAGRLAVSSRSGTAPGHRAPPDTVDVRVTRKRWGSAADQPCLVGSPDRRAGPPPAAGLRGRRGVALRPGRGAALGEVGQQTPVPAGGRARRADQPGRDGGLRRGVAAGSPAGRAGRHDRGGVARRRQANQAMVRLVAVPDGRRPVPRSHPTGGATPRSPRAAGGGRLRRRGARRASRRSPLTAGNAGRPARPGRRV